MVDPENPDISLLELAEFYSQRNREIFGDVRERIRDEIDTERERIARIIASARSSSGSPQRQETDVVTNLEPEERRVNILSVRLPSLELNKKKNKTKARTVDSEKERAIHATKKQELTEQTILRESDVHAIPCSIEVKKGTSRSPCVELNGEEVMSKKTIAVEDEKEERGSNGQATFVEIFEGEQGTSGLSSLEPNDGENESKKAATLDTKQAVKTILNPIKDNHQRSRTIKNGQQHNTGRRNSTGQLQTVERDQVEQNMTSRRSRRRGLNDFTGGLQERTQARVMIKRFGKDYDEEDTSSTTHISTSKLKRFLSLRNIAFKR